MSAVQSELRSIATCRCASAEFGTDGTATDRAASCLTLRARGFTRMTRVFLHARPDGGRWCHPRPRECASCHRSGSSTDGISTRPKSIGTDDMWGICQCAQGGLLSHDLAYDINGGDGVLRPESTSGEDAISRLAVLHRAVDFNMPGASGDHHHHHRTTPRGGAPESPTAPSSAPSGVSWASSSGTT